MALSQIQKKIISTMASSPQEVLDGILKGKINVEGFRGEFFQDGTGFTHTLLTMHSHYPDLFSDLLKHVLTQTNISFEESKGRTSSALGDLMNTSKNENMSQSNMLTLAFVMEHGFQKLSDGTFSRAMSALATHSYTELFNQLLDKKDKIKTDSYWNTAIEKLIIHDDLPSLKKLLSKLDNVELEKIQARKLNIQTYNRKEASNLLTLAIIYSPQIAHFFIDNYNFDLSGQIKQSRSYGYMPYNYGWSHDKTTHTSISPLAQSYYSRDFGLFDKLWDQEQTLNSLTSTQYINRNNSKKSSLIEMILEEDNDFYQFVKSKILKTPSFSKNNVLSFILNSSISLEEKLEFTQHIVPRIEDKELYKNTLLNSFLHQAYKDPIKESKDIDLIGKIFSTIEHDPKESIDHVSLDIFKVPLLNNSKLLKILIDSGYDMSQKNNPFIHYYALTEKLRNNELLNFYKEIDITQSQKSFDIIKKSYPEEIFLEYHKKNILDSALSNLDINLLKNLTQQEIDIFKTKENPVACLPRIDTTMEPLYTQVCHYLFDHDFPIAKNKLYEIITFCRDYDLIDKILEKEKLNIPELSKDADFWYYINHEDVANYVQSRGAVYSNTHITQKVMDYESDVFKLYIERGGSVDFKEGQNNILHLLIKNDMPDKATCVLKNHPALASEINEQNKIPLSYMLNKFNKECAIYHLRSQTSYKFRETLELFNTYIEYGAFNENEKSKKFIKEQLEKYSDIKKVIPDIDTIVLYKNIEAKAEEKHTQVRRVKI